MDLFKKAAEWSRKEDELQGAYEAAEARGDAQGMRAASDAIKTHHESRPAGDRLRHPIPGYDRG